MTTSGRESSDTVCNRTRIPGRREHQLSSPAFHEQKPNARPLQGRTAVQHRLVAANRRRSEVARGIPSRSVAFAAESENAASKKDRKVPRSITTRESVRLSFPRSYPYPGYATHRTTGFRDAETRGETGRDDNDETYREEEDFRLSVLELSIPQERKRRGVEAALSLSLLRALASDTTAAATKPRSFLAIDVNGG